MNLNLWLRRLHGYVGFLTAPMLLFFAATGMIQVLNLHQAHDGYQPPAIVRAMASLHKDQVLGRHRHGPPKPASPARGEPPRAPEPGPAAATVLLKAFVLLTASSLIVSVTFGLWIGLKDPRRRALHLGLLAVGTLLPAILILALR